MRTSNKMKEKLYIGSYILFQSMFEKNNCIIGIIKSPNYHIIIAIISKLGQKILQINMTIYIWSVSLRLEKFNNFNKVAPYIVQKRVPHNILNLYET